MIYADTDFFLALMKPTDWLQEPARKLFAEYRGQLCTSPATLIELILLAADLNIDPTRLVVDAMEIAKLRGGEVVSTSV